SECVRNDRLGSGAVRLRGSKCFPLCPESGPHDLGITPAASLLPTPPSLPRVAILTPVSGDASMHSSHGTFCGNSACTALESEFLVASGDIGHLELNWLAATGRKPRFVIGHGEDFTVSTNKNMNVRTDTLNRVFGNEARNAAAKHFWPHP